VRIPSVTGKRVRALTADQARAYIAAAPEQERALWACALYTGLRRGELGALRWLEVDLAAGKLRVVASYDWPTNERIAPKSAAGVRTVPIAPVLAAILVEHGLATGRTGEALVFGRSDTTPFSPPGVGTRGHKAFEAAGLKRLTLYESRHAMASLAIHGGMEPKMLQAILGHSSITMTLDVYSHLLPGHNEAAAALLTEAFA
jgi:integrase